MIAAIPPLDEDFRLEVLRDYGVLDVQAEPALEELAKLAAQICDVPVAMISLVDTDRLWFLAKVGTDLTGRRRDISFCGHLVEAHDVLIVPDATKDERFADNPLVAQEKPGIRFYAGVPLISPEEAVLGALCVIDHIPRDLTEEQNHALHVLARQVMTHLELRRSMRKLEESRRNLQIVTENARVGLIILDRERRYVYQNKAHAEIIGVPLASVLGKRVIEVMPDIYEWQIRPRLDRAFAGERVHYELIKPVKEGEICLEIALEPTIVDGQVPYVVGVVTDITESRRAEIAARRLAAIVEFSDDAIIGKNLNSIITSWNRGAEKVFGYTSDEMVGASIMRLIPDERWDEEAEILARIRLGQSIEHFETVRKMKDGRLIDVSVTVSPIKDAAGAVIGVSKVARDISEHKRTQQRMSMLDTCVAKLNDIVIVTEASPVDEPGPRIVFVNEAFQRVTGYTPEEALGRSPRMLQGEKTDKRVLGEIRDALLRQEPIRREIINYGKDGKPYWLEIDIAPIFDATGKCTHFAAIERDISDRKQSDEALRLFRLLIDGSNDAIEVIDAVTGRFLDVNETSCRRLGYTREEMLQLTVADVMGDTQEPFSAAEQLDMTKNAGARTVQRLHRRKDGSTFPTEINVQYVPINQGYVVAVARDITERTRALEQIAEQAALLDKARDAIIVRDLEGKVFFWNRGAELIYGWTREEVLGRKIGGMLLSDPRELEKQNQILLEHGESSGEVQHQTLSRGEITVDARRTLIRDEHGAPKSVLVIATDVTEKKKIEAQFLRAQRMESIGTLAGGVAHDLNNILAPIMMSVDVLKMLSMDPRAEEILETIGVSAARGADIVRQVLSFARGVEGQRIEVQPVHLLKEIANIVRETFPKDIDLRFTTLEDTWNILGDPTQLHQILLNLCVNARDAMPMGGNLIVSARNCDVDAQYVSMDPQARPGRYVVVSVSDTGTGIPPAVIDKIFEPFFTTKDVNKGTGLGLSTVMAIVKSHTGFINVVSEQGKGTAFHVYLPAAENGPAAAAAEGALAALPRGNGETILVVDDESSIRSITCGTLEAYGYRVLTARDGAHAVAEYASHKTEIHAVLVDMVMPIMDGTATILALMRLNPLVKVVACSGVSSGAGLARASQAGIKHFLAKPYTAATLLDTLQAILDEG
jgi:PAS domain S-box-containing protein